jgi:hypothetical protein
MKEKKTILCLKYILPLLIKYDPNYIISGGFASNLHGGSREVADIDISVNVDIFDELVNELREYIIEDYSESNYIDDSWDMKIVTFNILGQEVDIFTHTQNRIFSILENRWVDLIFKEYVLINYQGLVLNVIPLEELISYKEHTRRDVDLLDIEELKENLKR